MNFEIKKLKDFCTIIAGQSPESKYYNTNGDGLPFFQGKADFGALYPTIRVYCSQPTKIAQKDDILLSVRAPVGPTNLSPGEVCIGRGLTAIRPDESVSLKYLMCFFKYFQAQLESKGTGTTFNAITQNIIKNIEVPIPSLDDQQRIVSRIEELSSNLDEAVQTLQTTKQQLAVYRQAVLKEAFIPAYQHAKPIPISETCEDIKVGIVIKPKQYYVDSSEGVRAFRSLNVREFHVNNNDWVYLSKEGHKINSRSEIHTGDVLVVRSGAPGTACVVPAEYDGCNAIDIIIAVPDKKKILPEFLCAFTNSPDGRVITQKHERGVAQRHLNVSGYSKTEIPVPDITVQRKILEEIESRLSVCDSIEKTVDDSLVQAEALRQSILKKAFEGGLV